MKVRLECSLELVPHFCKQNLVADHQNLHHYHIPQHPYPRFINKFHLHQKPNLPMAILFGKLSHF